MKRRGRTGAEGGGTVSQFEGNHTSGLHTEENPLDCVAADEQINNLVGWRHPEVT